MRALLLALLLALIPSMVTVAYAEENPLQKAAQLAEDVRKTLETLAVTMIFIAALIGIIHYVLGRGPEWLGRAVLAAIGLAVVMWLISQFISSS